MWVFTNDDHWSRPLVLVVNNDCTLGPFTLYTLTDFTLSHFAFYTCPVTDDHTSKNCEI